MTTSSTPATPYEIADLVTKTRARGHYVSEAAASKLYGANLSLDQVRAALLDEMARAAEIGDICEARGVPEVKAELQASGVPVAKALDRIGEAVSIKAAVRMASTSIYPMGAAETSKMSTDFITKRVAPQHVNTALLELAASRDEATAITSTAPTTRQVGSREAAKASMARELTRQGITPR